ncbi:MAG: MarR family transcriptional regulator [Gudongella sp.]|nr:MarR family transcriptional regulator [Gudongella sp.]
MDKALKDQYMNAMFRFKKAGMILAQRSDLNMTELMLMKGVAKNSLFSGDNMNLSEIHNKLHITKSAISQMMNSLEKKGYIEREIDKTDRRKVIVTLTRTGLDVLKEARESSNQIFEEIISRLGDENTKQLIELLDKVSDITEDLKNEIFKDDNN